MSNQQDQSELGKVIQWPITIDRIDWANMRAFASSPAHGTDRLVLIYPTEFGPPMLGVMVGVANNGITLAHDRENRALIPYTSEWVPVAYSFATRQLVSGEDFQFLEIESIEHFIDICQSGWGEGYGLIQEAIDNISPMVGAWFALRHLVNGYYQLLPGATSHPGSMGGRKEGGDA